MYNALLEKLRQSDAVSDAVRLTNEPRSTVQIFISKEIEKHNQKSDCGKSSQFVRSETEAIRRKVTLYAIDQQYRDH